MSNQPTCQEITLTHEPDGTFVLKTDSGEVIHYQDQYLIHALEEIVFKFRNRKPKFTVAVQDQYSQAPVVGNPQQRAAQAPRHAQQQRPRPGQPSRNDMARLMPSPEEMAENNYNGGLGPRIQGGNGHINGFGPTM